MRVNICSCLLALVLGCNVTAEIIHQIVEEKNNVALRCPDSVKDTVKWTRETNGRKVDLLTDGRDKTTKHINDGNKRYAVLADKSLTIIKVNVSDSGKYLCNEAAVILTVIPSGTRIVDVTEGSTAALTCPHDVGGSHGPTWSREIGGRQQPIRRHVSPVNKMLIISDVQPGDSGLYYCDGKPAEYLEVTKGDQTENRKKTTTTTTTITTTTPAAPVNKDQELVLGIVTPSLLVLFIVAVYCIWTHRCRRQGDDEDNHVYNEVQDETWKPTEVIRFSVPEDHHLHLSCRGADGSDVVWTRQDRKVLVTRHGNYETNQDRQRYHLLPDGGLCLLQLDDSDSGEYRCNQQLVAQLQVLTGRDFLVSAGWTLLLPCSSSSKPRQRWYHRRKGGRQVAIFTRYRNGTLKPERDDRRYIFENNALQILDMQPGDAGEYLCNKEVQARVTVLTALLVAAVVTSGLMILLMAAVCVLLSSMKCRRKRKHKRADCDAVESSSPPEETIHYASLGRENWRERPSRTPDQNHHSVIYSSVFTRPAANGKQKHTQTWHHFSLRNSSKPRIYLQMKTKETSSDRHEGESESIKGCLFLLHQQTEAEERTQDHTRETHSDLRKVLSSGRSTAAAVRPRWVPAAVPAAVPTAVRHRWVPTAVPTAVPAASSMPDLPLCLEALSALCGCNVETTSGASQLSPQDFVNIVALKEFYKQEGLKELDYPSLGTLSLQDVDDLDMYSSPPALPEAPTHLITTVKINPQDFLHPQYNYDFTNIKDGDTKYLRGNEQYIRPCGWNRVALRVVQRYDGGDQWLGTGKDAWPVSYHGHNMDGSLGIILTRANDPEDDPTFLDAAAASLVAGETQGRGVYSTPHIKVAQKYCRKFKSKVDGKMYEVLLQNRINPEKRKTCQREDVWLVYIPKGCNDVQMRTIVQESIRPYGLLLKQL
ncbi:hypothetical protein PAMA_011976 [Pampus argenteus]